MSASAKWIASDGGATDDRTGARRPLQDDAAPARSAIASVDLARRDFRKILLIKLSAAGDIIHTIPVLNKLRRRYPSARIDWVLRPALAELIRYHSAISNVILFERETWAALRHNPWRPLASAANLIRQLRALRYDLVIDLHGQARTALLALASGAPVRIGFDRPRREARRAAEQRLPREAFRHCWQGAREGSWVAYSHRIRVPTLDMYGVDRYLIVARMLGCDDGAADFSFTIPAAASRRADEMLAEHGIRPGGALIVIAPGTTHETRHWTREGFAAVARHFLGRGFAVVLAGAPSDRAACNAVESAAPRVANLVGQTSLSELAALIRRSSLCLANESAPTHFAVALGRPVVSIFGATEPLWNGPYRRPDSVIRAALPCSPCYLRELRHCRHDHACMRGVPAQRVTRGAGEQLPRLSDGDAALRIADQHAGDHGG